MKPITIVASIVFFLIIALPVSAQMSVIATNPSPIIAGDYADITVQFRRGAIMGDSRDNVTLFIKETDFIKPLPNQEFVIPTLQENQMVGRTFRVFFTEDIPPGKIPITLVESYGSVRVEYRDDIVVQGSSIRADMRIGSMRSVPNRLLSDSEDNTLFLTLQNVGDKKAELLKITLESDYLAPAYFNSMVQSISSLDGGEEKEVAFDFDILPVVRNGDSVEATAIIEYRERNRLDTAFELRTIRLPVVLNLAQAPDFSISAVEPESTIRVGGKGQAIVFTITNLNEREGENVRLRLFPNPASPFDFEKTSYFLTPRLRENEEVAVRIEFDVLSSALVQEYIVLAEIESVLGQNRFVQTIDVPIEITRGEPSTIRQNAIAIVLILLILAFIIGYFSLRKRK